MSHTCSCGREHFYAGRERLNVAGWYEMLEDHLGYTTLGADALDMAVSLAEQAARVMRGRRSKAGRDEVMERLKDLSDDLSILSATINNDF